MPRPLGGVVYSSVTNILIDALVGARRIVPLHQFYRIIYFRRGEAVPRPLIRLDPIDVRTHRSAPTNILIDTLVGAQCVVPLHQFYRIIYFTVGARRCLAH